MPDEKPKAKTGENNGPFISWAAIVWLIFTAFVFLISQQVVSLQDEERFVNDIEVTFEELDEPNTVRLTVVAGTFEYLVIPEDRRNVESGTYTPDDDDLSPIAQIIIETLDEATEVNVSPTEIVIPLAEDAEVEAAQRRLRNPLFEVLRNERQAVNIETGEGELRVVTTDETFIYAVFIPALVDEGESYEYPNREAASNGIPLAQTIVELVPTVEALAITSDEIVVQYREGALARNIADRVQAALNEFFPRASLQPDLWVISLGSSASTVIDIVPVDTGLPLYLFTLLFALIEGGFAYAFRNSADKLLRPLVRVAFVFLAFWSIFGHEPIWDALLSQFFPASQQLVHPNQSVIEFTAEHLELVIVSSLITIPGGLAFGILVTRSEFRELLPLVNNLVNSGQTVPTIAIVAIMAPIIGFGFWPAIIALIAYGLLPVVRNTIAGLEGVDRFIIDSAKGMGLTPAQILYRVELPIASRVIMAGIRTSMVINVGTATLGAFVGSGGLGTPIASGLSMSIDAFVLLGALPAALLAILVDYILGRIEYVITPRGLQIIG